MSSKAQKANVGPTSPVPAGTQQGNQLALEVARQMGIPVETLNPGDTREALGVLQVGAFLPLAQLLQAAAPAFPALLQMVMEEIAASRADREERREREAKREKREAEREANEARQRFEQTAAKTVVLSKLRGEFGAEVVDDVLACQPGYDRSLSSLIEECKRVKRLREPEEGPQTMRAW